MVCRYGIEAEMMPNDNGAIGITPEPLCELPQLLGRHLSGVECHLSAAVRRHSSDYFHQFRHDGHLALIGAREDDGFKLGIGRLERDLGVLP